MVELRKLQATTDQQFLIRPNQSMSCRGTILFVTVMCVSSFGIAGWFMALGAWMVLPFAGLEMLVLGVGVYFCFSASRREETITLSADELRIERRHRHVKQVWVFQRYWAKVVMWQDLKSWYPSRLFIRSHGRSVEIGAWLTEPEREQLAMDLRHALS